jgi:hypothetical protein
MIAKRVLSPELQECMDPNEGSAATGARGRMSRETPKRVRAHRQERTSVPVGCERARRRNQRNLRSNPPSGSSANHGSRRRHPATLHHHPACALVVVHSSHAQALEQNGITSFFFIFLEENRPPRLPSNISQLSTLSVSTQRTRDQCLDLCVCAFDLIDRGKRSRPVSAEARGCDERGCGRDTRHTCT